MTKHIDRQRKALLARRDYLLANLDPRDHYLHETEAELDQINEALAKLDEVAATGDTRQYPRLKVRKVPPWIEEVTPGEELGDRRWVVSQRFTRDDETEQVLGFLPDLVTAHGAAIEYVAVQRFLAARTGGTK